MIDRNPRRGETVYYIHKVNDFPIINIRWGTVDRVILDKDNSKVYLNNSNTPLAYQDVYFSKGELLIEVAKILESLK